MNKAHAKPNWSYLGKPQLSPAALRQNQLSLLKSSAPIWVLWGRFGYPSPPTKDGLYSSPFREDRTPSFSISEAGRLWFDHSEGVGGSGIDFIMRARGCDKGGAIRWLKEFAAGMAAPLPSMDCDLTTEVPAPASELKVHAKKPLPKHRLPSEGELSALAALRGFGPNVSGLAEMVRRGLLRVADQVFEKQANGDCCRVRAYIFTDSYLRCAMIRRCDGEPWRCIAKPGEKPKKSRTWSRAQGESRWPVGCALLALLREGVKLVLFVEGAPDLAAAHVLLYDFFGDNHERMREVAIVGMASASVAIHQDALEFFDGLSVLIVPHIDAGHDGRNPGEEAAQKWSAQLRVAGATVSIFRLRDYLPPNGKDLCDATAHALRLHFRTGGTSAQSLTLSRHLFSFLT